MSPVVKALKRQVSEAQAAIEDCQKACPHAEEHIIKTHHHLSVSGGEYVNEREWYWETERRCGWCDKWLGQVKGKL